MGQISSLRDYLRQWYRNKGSVTFWIHISDQQGRQEHPTSIDCDVTGDFSAQIREALDLPDQSFHLILVDPPPVLLVLPRPHVIASVHHDQKVSFLVLCQTNVDGRRYLLSLQLSIQYPPVGDATVFDEAIPGHPCEESAECYIISENRRWQYHHDIAPRDGGFYRLFVWTRDEDVRPSVGWQ